MDEHVADMVALIRVRKILVEDNDNDTDAEDPRKDAIRVIENKLLDMSDTLARYIRAKCG